MNNQTRLEFRLVPTKGVASGKGFRAEWTRTVRKYFRPMFISLIGITFVNMAV